MSNGKRPKEKKPPPVDNSYTGDPRDVPLSVLHPRLGWGPQPFPLNLVGPGVFPKHRRDEIPLMVDYPPRSMREPDGTYNGPKSYGSVDLSKIGLTDLGGLVHPRVDYFMPGRSEGIYALSEMARTETPKGAKLTPTRGFFGTHQNHGDLPIFFPRPNNEPWAPIPYSVSLDGQYKPETHAHEVNHILESYGAPWPTHEYHNRLGDSFMRLPLSAAPHKGVYRNEILDETYGLLSDVNEPVPSKTDEASASSFLNETLRLLQGKPMSVPVTPVKYNLADLISRYERMPRSVQMSPTNPVDTEMDALYENIIHQTPEGVDYSAEVRKLLRPPMDPRMVAGERTLMDALAEIASGRAVSGPNSVPPIDIDALSYRNAILRQRATGLDVLRQYQALNRRPPAATLVKTKPR